MRFFSKIVLICNICFISSVILRYVEMADQKNERLADVLKYQPLASTIVVLGYGAIIINFVFNLVVLMMLILKAINPAPKWIIWFNFLLLIIQIYYFS